MDYIIKKKNQLAMIIEYKNEISYYFDEYDLIDYIYYFAGVQVDDGIEYLQSQDHNMKFWKYEDLTSWSDACLSLNNEIINDDLVREAAIYLGWIEEQK